MNAHDAGGRLLVGLAVMALLGGCAAGAGPTQEPATPVPASLPSAAVATPRPTVPATASPATTPSVVVTTDLSYESTNPELTPDALDVYAPAKAGPWPVVVMFHGALGPNPGFDRGTLSENARRVAELGFVVFNASWGHGPGMAADPPNYDGRVANNSQGACAVEFARRHAAEYGGDPSTMIVFGYSGGAHIGAMVAFARPAPTAGCLGGATLGPIDALVTWEGNWLLSVMHPTILDWDGIVAADPRIMDAVTPWKYIAEHKDQKVVMLVSEDPSLSFESEFPGVLVDREVGDPWAADSWLAVRDPSGDLRRQLEASGAFADSTLTFVEVQQFLYSALKAQGNPVSIDTMPDSSHAWLAGKGWDVFLAAFPKAAAQD